MGTFAPLVARLREHLPPPARFSLHFAPPRDAVTIACAELLEPAMLRRFFVGALSDLTDAPDRQDQRIAGQRFFKKYSAAILPASLLTLAHGLAVDVSIARLRFAVEGDLLRGLVVDPLANARTTPMRRAAWAMDVPTVPHLDQLRAHALDTLFFGNLAPAADAVLGAVRVSRRLLWCSVSEQVDLFYAGARLAGVADAAVLDADRDLLLNAETLPSGRPNPLHGTFEWELEPEFGRSFMVREVCCMQFKIRREARYCGTCGLPTPEERGVLRRKAARDGSDPRIPAEHGSLG